MKTKTERLVATLTRSLVDINLKIRAPVLDEKTERALGKQRMLTVELIEVLKRSVEPKPKPPEEPGK